MYAQSASTRNQSKASARQSTHTRRPEMSFRGACDVTPWARRHLPTAVESMDHIFAYSCLYPGNVVRWQCRQQVDYNDTENAYNNENDGSKDCNILTILTHNVLTVLKQTQLIQNSLTIFENNQWQGEQWQQRRPANK